MRGRSIELQTQPASPHASVLFARCSLCDIMLCWSLAHVCLNVLRCCFYKRCAIATRSSSSTCPTDSARAILYPGAMQQKCLLALRSVGFAAWAPAVTAGTCTAYTASALSGLAWQQPSLQRACFFSAALGCPNVNFTALEPVALWRLRASCRRQGSEVQISLPRVGGLSHYGP